MQKFLAVFLGSDAANEGWAKLDAETKKQKESEGMTAWGKWMEDHKADIANEGSPLGKTKHVNKDGITDTKNALAAWVVVQAGSHDEAAKMFENHPHFSIFPGDSVEIMPCLDMPTLKK